MKRLFATTLLVLLSLGISSNTGSAESFPSQALLTAEQFVSIVDNEDFSAAYRQASEILRIINSEQEWTAEQRRHQQVLGRVLERQLIAVRARDAHAGFPDGNYLIVCFESRTEFKQKAIEVVLVGQLGEDWRVCKYSIR